MTHLAGSLPATVNVTYFGVCPVHGHNQTFTSYAGPYEKAPALGNVTMISCALDKDCPPFAHKVVGLCLDDFAARQPDDLDDDDQQLAQSGRQSHDDDLRPLRVLELRPRRQP